MPAVETLGSSNVICSDKTGTLTQNKMTVTQVFSNNIEQNIKFNKEILQLASMCTDCAINYKNNGQIVEGEATEKAIVEAAIKQNINKDELYKQMQRINEVAFDSKRKLMTTIHKNGNGYKIITKGAPDVLLNKCNKIYLNGKIVSLDTVQKEMIIKENEKMANNALRVIAVAYLDINVLPIKIDESIENNLIFVGLIGMIDPPRPGVKEAVETCRQAGIKTVMITGDHIITARAIAKELGILTLGDKTITGEELEKMPQKQLEKNIMNYSVFARVSPEHKVRIVKAFRAKGNIVAMTGDGVNDAPALKNADIGIAMGKNGTDVAKNAADMILTDDNFVTIVEAVGEASGEIPYTAYFAKKSYIEKNQDVIQGFTNAIYKGEKWVKEHTAREIAEVILSFFPDTSLDMVTASVQSYMDIDAWKGDPVLKEESFDLLQEVIKEAGELEKEADYNKVVNNSFAEKSIQKIGK